MSILDRLGALFRGKSPDTATPTGELTMADAQSKQQAAVQKMRRGVADVSVSRQRLDLQAADLQKALDVLVAQAVSATAAGDGGLAQTAEARQLVMREQLADLTSQRDALAEQESMLIAALTQLQARVSGFNVTAETLKAAQTAAQAHHSIAKSLHDLDGPGK